MRIVASKTRDTEVALGQQKKGSEGFCGAPCPGVSRCWCSRRGLWPQPPFLFSSTCLCLSVATARRCLLLAAACLKRQQRREDGSTIMFTRRLTPRDANKQYPRQSENSCTGNAGSNRFLVCRLNETHGCSNLTTRAAIASLAKFDIRNRSCFRRRSSGYCCHGQLILIGATDYTLQEHRMARRRISEV